MALSKNRKLLLGLVGGALAIAAFSLLMWLFIIGWEVPPEPTDKQRGVTAAFVADFYNAPEYAEANDSILRTRYLDGSWTVEVDSESDAGLSTSTFYSVDVAQRDARQTYAGLLLTAPLVGMIEDVEVRDNDELFDWGDASSAKLLLFDGEPIGHVLVARKGSVSFSCTIAGIYIDDREELEGVMAQLLASAERDG